MKNIDFRNGRPLVMMVSQYDYGYDLQVALWSNGDPVTITAASVISENFTTTCTFSGNVVTIPVTTSMTEQFGHFPAELRVADSLGQVSSKNFDFFVERSPLAVKSTQTYSGDIVEFTAKSVPLNSVVVTMEPIQDLNGYSSPWPAGGGKNKLATSLETDHAINTNGVVGKYNNDGTYTLTSVNPPSTSIFVINTDMANGGTPAVQNPGKKTLPNGTYKVVFADDSPNNFRVQVLGTNNATGTSEVTILVNTHSGTFTIDDTYAYNWIRLSCTPGVDLTNITIRPMILLESETDETFEPYSNVCPISGRTGASVLVNSEHSETGATTYSITFTSAGTVYAGTVDLVSGVLTVTHAGVTLDGSETYSRSGIDPGTGIACATSQFEHAMASGSWLNDEHTLCSSLPKVATTGDFGIRFGANNANLYFYEMGQLGITTIEAFKSWVADNNIQITYPLATPLTYNLTPVQVMSLLGENVVWSPDGAIEVVVPEFY